MSTLDLRSDTVTKPDAAMRRAMARAEVGDDVLGEDPTVRALEEEAARAMGKEAAIFVPSGTMGNEIALHLHAKPGTEVICEASSHIVNYEMAGMAALSGLLPRAVTAPRGILTAELIEGAVAPDVSYQAPSGMLSLENTANMAGGTVCSLQALEASVAVARGHDLPVHLDGARIFNAAEALGVEPSAVAASADSVMFCLSKGLGAPVGSMLCGSRSFTTEARRVRKMFGGGMRQAGVLAAAGLLALREGPSRLRADHERARRLAGALEAIRGVRLVEPPETNIVIVELETPAATKPAFRFSRGMADVGILCIAVSDRRVRFVTHRDVDEARFQAALESIEGFVWEN